MGIFAKIEVQGKHVLIVGGGSVAYRKAKLFLAEGAHVHILAPCLCPELKQANIHYIEGSYPMDGRNNYFIVVAATNDENINKKVVKDCEEHNIVCMSVHQTCDASMKTMVGHSAMHYEVALSTKGKYPALTNIMLETVKEMLDTTMAERLSRLSQLRSWVLDNVQDQETKREILTYAAMLDSSSINFLLQAILEKKALVIALHGKDKKEEMDKELRPFVSALQANQPHAVAYACLGRLVCSRLKQQGECIFEFKAIMNILHKLPTIEINVFPLVLQDGRYYQTIKAVCLEYGCYCYPLPFSNEEDIKELISILYKKYHTKDSTLLMTYHGSTYESFALYEQKLRTTHTTIHFLNELHIDTTDISNFHNVILLPLYILAGYHEHQDCMKLKNRLEKTGCTTQVIRTSCMQEEGIRQLLENKICNYLK